MEVGIDESNALPE